MLHGVLGLHAKSGGLLFSKAFTPSFGLPEIPGSPPMDPHRLSSLIFALQINATATTVGQAKKGPALEGVQFGSVRMIFHCTQELPDLLIVLCVDLAMRPDVERHLLLSISTTMSGKYGEEISSQASQNRVRRLKGATGVLKECVVEHVSWLLRTGMDAVVREGKPLWAHAWLDKDDHTIKSGVDEGGASNQDEAETAKTRDRNSSHSHPHFDGVAASGPVSAESPRNEELTEDGGGKRKKSGTPKGQGLLSSMLRKVRRRRLPTAPAPMPSAAPLVSIHLSASGEVHKAGTCLKGGAEEAAAEEGGHRRLADGVVRVWGGEQRVEAGAGSGDWAVLLQENEDREEVEAEAPGCGCGPRLWGRRSGVQELQGEWRAWWREGGSEGGGERCRVVGVEAGRVRVAVCVEGEGTAGEAEAEAEGGGHGEPKDGADAAGWGGAPSSLEEVAVELERSLEFLHRHFAPHA